MFSRIRRALAAWFWPGSLQQEFDAFYHLGSFTRGQAVLDILESARQAPDCFELDLDAVINAIQEQRV